MGSGSFVSDVNSFVVGDYIYIYNTSGNENYNSGSVQNTLIVSVITTPVSIPISGGFITSITQQTVEEEPETIEETDCSEDWDCSEWTECSKGVKTRECVNKNQCTDSRKETVEESICEIEIPQEEVVFVAEQENTITGFTTLLENRNFTILGAASFLIVIVILFSYITGKQPEEVDYKAYLLKTKEQKRLTKNKQP